MSGYGNGGADDDGGWSRFCEDQQRVRMGGPSRQRSLVPLCVRCNDTGKAGLEERGAAIRAIPCVCEAGRRLAEWLGRQGK